jgi:hypothetical protein
MNGGLTPHLMKYAAEYATRGCCLTAVYVGLRGQHMEVCVACSIYFIHGCAFWNSVKIFRYCISPRSILQLSAPIKQVFFCYISVHNSLKTRTANAQYSVHIAHK